MTIADTARTGTPRPITATFIDEATYSSAGIAASNWGPSDWAKEFEGFVAAGIDTVVLIRGGIGSRLSHPSLAISEQLATLPVYFDMAELLLTLADEAGIAFYFGLYDSHDFWLRHDWKREVEINRPYIAEVWSRYGHHSSFAGWYLPHETHDTGMRIVDLNVALAELCKNTADLPTLSSPYWYGHARMSNGAKGAGGRLHSLDEIGTQWDEVMSSFSGVIDILAFQDGTVADTALDATLALTREIADRHGIELWSNVEAFDRDASFEFPPIDWRRLVYRLDCAARHTTKTLTFEWSTFLSPNALTPSARNLNARYTEYLAGEFA